MVSYADEVNTLVVTNALNYGIHSRMVDKVNGILEKQAGMDHLKWDKNKDSIIRFRKPLRDQTATLGITVNSALKFHTHIDARTKKARRLWDVRRRLGNSASGMSPKAIRSHYKGAIRAAFSYRAEIWNDPHYKTNTSEMEGLEYQALRKITEGYHGSSKDKLGYIANIKPQR